MPGASAAARPPASRVGGGCKGKPDARLPHWPHPHTLTLERRHIEQTLARNTTDTDMEEDPTETRVDCQIGISVYKQPINWVKQSVLSALTQENCREFIVSVRIDGPDGCSEDCAEWLTQMSDTRENLTIIHGKKRLGTFASYQQIFSTSESTYLCQLDADDWLEKDAIKRSVHLLQAYPEAPFSYTDCTEINKDGAAEKQGLRSLVPYSRQKMLVQFITFHLRVIRRSAYKKSGGYDASLLYTGDYDLSLKLCEIGDPAHLKYRAYNYRIHDLNTSKTKRKQLLNESLLVAQQSLKRQALNHLYELRTAPSSNKTFLELRKGPIVIAGMHRSGTSLLANMLETLGLNLGEKLQEADQYNPDGYKEDTEILNINRNLFKRLLNSEQGWPDWGWTTKSNDEEQSLEPDRLWEKEATEYLARRAKEHQLFGWKDPRNSLLLNSFDKINDNIKVIAVYRAPWEIVEALQSLQSKIFQANPHWCIKIWAHYNQKLIDFHAANPHKIILIKSEDLKEDPSCLPKVLSKKWKWPTGNSLEIHSKN